MRFLISNDDGVFAPGLLALYESLSKLGEVVVVAPDSEQSGSASALSVVKPLYPQKLASGFVAVNGSPADCIYLALHELFADVNFDWVISGINSGANFGQDVLFSGTFGAAATAQMFGVPAMAVSLAMVAAVGCGQDLAKYYESAADEIVTLLGHHELMAGFKNLPYHVLNVNIPDRSACDIKGQKITALGHRSLLNPVHKLIDPRGREAYWLSLKKDPNVSDERIQATPYLAMTDAEAVAAGWVSLSPVRLPYAPSQSLYELDTLLNNYD